MAELANEADAMELGLDNGKAIEYSVEALVMASKLVLTANDFSKFQEVFTKFDNIDIQEQDPEYMFYGLINSLFVNFTEFLK